MNTKSKRDLSWVIDSIVRINPDYRIAFLIFKCHNGESDVHLLFSQVSSIGIDTKCLYYINLVLRFAVTPTHHYILIFE